MIVDDDLITKDTEFIVKLAEQDNSVLINTIIGGLHGNSIGIPTSIEGIDTNSYGLQKARYILIGAASGVGKTTLADQAYVIEPILALMFVKYKAEVFGMSALSNKEVFLLGLDIKINYWSFEISKEMKILKWASYLLFKFFGIRAGVDYLANVKGEGFIHKEVWDKILIVDKIISKMLKYINFYDEAENPTGVYKTLKEFAKQNGKFDEAPYTDHEGNKKTRIVGYKPNNPKLYVVNVFDHLALLAKERGFDTKATIDKLSEYCVYFRNRCNFTTVAIQQFNGDLFSIERQKQKGYALAPQPSDFGDSRYTFRDADLVFGLFKPSAYDIDSFEGYNILPKNSSDSSYLGDAAVFLFNLKQRYGKTNWVVPLALDGLVGQFSDLPVVELFRASMVNYSDFTQKPTFNKDECKTDYTKFAYWAITE